MMLILTSALTLEVSVAEAQTASTVQKSASHASKDPSTESVVKDSAVSAQACGLYELRGWVRVSGSDFFLVLNEKSKSEIRLKVPFRKDMKLYGFRNRFVEVQAKLLQPMNGTEGEVAELLEAKLARPHLWVEGGEPGLKLLKPQACEGKPRK